MYIHFVAENVVESQTLLDQCLVEVRNPLFTLGVSRQQNLIANLWLEYTLIIKVDQHFRSARLRHSPCERLLLFSRFVFSGQDSLFLFKQVVEDHVLYEVTLDAFSHKLEPLVHEDE